MFPQKNAQKGSKPSYLCATMESGANLDQSANFALTTFMETFWGIQPFSMKNYYGPSKECETILNN